MKKTAANKRFGVSRGVCSRKVLQEFESLSPVRTFVFPRPNAKPPTDDTKSLRAFVSSARSFVHVLSPAGLRTSKSFAQAAKPCAKLLAVSGKR